MEKYYKFSIDRAHCHVIGVGKTMEEAKERVDKDYKESKFIREYDLKDLDVDVIGTFIKFETKVVQVKNREGIRGNY